MNRALSVLTLVSTAFCLLTPTVSAAPPYAYRNYYRGRAVGPYVGAQSYYQPQYGPSFGGYYGRYPAVAGRSSTSATTYTPYGPVQSHATYDPRTGRSTARTYSRNPYTGAIDTSETTYDARTGRQTAKTKSVNPWTGGTARSRVNYNPYTGEYFERTGGQNPWNGAYYGNGGYSPYSGGWQY